MALCMYIHGYPQRNCKDDLKLFTCDDSKVELSPLPLTKVFYGIFNDWAKKEINYDGINSVQ